MKNILYKELRLCMPARTLIFFAFVSMLLIPDYPYLVAGFFICNGIFQMFTQSAVDNDITFTSLLPVSKKDAVRGKQLFVICIQAASLLLFLAMVFVNFAIYRGKGNNAGTDASLTFLGAILLLYSLFNSVFLPAFYKTPHKFGNHFLKATIVTFVFIVLFEGFMIAAGAAAEHVPFFAWVKENLKSFPQTPGAWTAQAVFFSACAAVYALSSVFAGRAAAKNFDKVDL